MYDPDVVVLEGWNLTPKGLAESLRRVASFCAGVPYGVADANARADADADADADEGGNDYDYDSKGDGRDKT